HCFGNNDDCIFVQSDKEPNELIEILACIDFKFEELVDDSLCMSEKAVGLILEEHFGAEIIEGTVEKYLLVGTKMPKSDKRNLELFKVFDIPGYESPVLQIDRYWARESCCGPNSDMLMEKHIPFSNDFDEMIKHSEIG